MATSAFKSTSRRRGGGSESEKGPPIRRSRSVSVLPSAYNFRPLDFLNKRDNPLFRSSECADAEIEDCSTAREPRFVDGERERGRSVTRNHPRRFINNKEEPPTTDKRKGRRPVVSAGRHYVLSETEADKESAVSFNYERRSSWNATANNLKAGAEEVDMQTQATEHHGIGYLNKKTASNTQTPIVKDWDSTSSFLGVEEKAFGDKIEGNQIMGGETAAGGIYETVRSEVRRAIFDIQSDLGSVILKNNAAAITVTNVADIPPDLKIRREYATKLEECQERARKLRADLLVEEHRGQELKRILKELPPDPMANILQRTRPQKKNSTERKKMTKRLTEEALAYFDECVSLSTFDSSDFSAAEDQSLVLNGATTAVGRSPFSVQGSPSVSGSCCPSSYLDHKQGSGGPVMMHSQTSSSLTACSSSDEPPLIDKASCNINRGRKLHFSFSSEPNKNAGLEDDIKSYTSKNVVEFSSSSKDKNSCNDIGEYGLCCPESMLYDKILCKNRTDSGTLHLCDGGDLGISVSALGPVI